jgi:hypothetical protein
MPVDRSPMAEGGAVGGDAWLSMLRRYFLFVAIGSLLWEVAQLPLYTIWAEGTAGEIAFAVLHCTGGDLLIAGFSLLVALLLFAETRWPAGRHGMVAAASIVTAVAFTVYSEWRNVEVLGNWAYSEWMPTLPVIGTGLSPLAQWIVVPISAFWWGRRAIELKGGDA